MNAKVVIFEITSPIDKIRCMELVNSKNLRLDYHFNSWSPVSTVHFYDWTLFLTALAKEDSVYLVLGRIFREINLTKKIMKIYVPLPSTLETMTKLIKTTELSNFHNILNFYRCFNFYLSKIR